MGLDRAFCSVVPVSLYMYMSLCLLYVSLSMISVWWSQSYRLMQ